MGEGCMSISRLVLVISTQHMAGWDDYQLEGGTRNWMLEKGLTNVCCSH